MSLRCPACNASLSLVVTGSTPTAAPPPVLRSSPALSSVPEDRETIQEREARLKVLRGWYEAAPPGVRGRIDDIVTMRLSDWRGRKVREGRRLQPEDEARRKRALFDEALEEHVKDGWLRSPRPRPNETSQALPRGDRDEDPSEEE